MLELEWEKACKAQKRAGKISQGSIVCHLEHQRKHQWGQQRSNPIRTMQVIECFTECILKTERNDVVDADIQKSKAYTPYKLRRQQNTQPLSPARHNSPTRHNRQS